MTEALSESPGRAGETLVPRFSPAEVILFGSHARGDAGPDSDVDLPVLPDRVESSTRMAGEMYSAQAGAGIAKDIGVGTVQQAARHREVPDAVFRPSMGGGRILHESAT